MSEISWTIELPQKKQAVLGQAKPKAKIILETEVGGTEEFFVPSTVARALLSKEKDGVFTPSSRNEFLYEVKEISTQCIKARIEALIVKRDYSTAELQKKLMLDGYQKNVRDPAVQRAVEVGLVNDSRFADVYIRSKISQSWGPLKIKTEISKKGIEVETLPGWPDAYFSDVDEFEVAYSLAQRKHLSGKMIMRSLSDFSPQRDIHFL